MRKGTNCLCLDIGNTSCRAGVWSNGKFIDQKSIGTNDFILEATLWLESWTNIKQVSYCSVVPDAEESLLEAYSSTKGYKLFHLTAQSQMTLPIDYPEPHEIGPDRIANSYATYRKYKLPAVVVDLGTATTFDVITESGYAGGVIAPGPQGILDFLGSRTALLPKINYQKEKRCLLAVGKSTKKAMLSGLYNGYLPMIRAILQSIITEMSHKNVSINSIVQTGGEAENFLIKEASLDKTLTLEGLAMAYIDKQLESCK